MSPVYAKRLFVDWDGVLVNMTKGLAKAFDLDYDGKDIYPHAWMQTACGMPLETFLEKWNGLPDFWDHLELYPWSGRFIQFLDSTFPEWISLTHALHHRNSWGGKFGFMERYLVSSGSRRLVMLPYGFSKSIVARPGDILIDDYPVNCQEWEAAGGTAFRWIPYGELNPLGVGQVDLCRRFLEIQFQS